MSPPLVRRAACPRCATVVALSGDALGDKRLDCAFCHETWDLGPEDWRDPPPAAATSLATRRGGAGGGVGLVAVEDVPGPVRIRSGPGAITLIPKVTRAHLGRATLGSAIVAILGAIGQPPELVLGAIVGAVALLPVLAALLASRREVAWFEKGGMIVRWKNLWFWPGSGVQLTPGAPVLVVVVRRRASVLGVDEHLVRVQQNDRRLELGRGLGLSLAQAEALAAEVRARLATGAKAGKT